VVHDSDEGWRTQLRSLPWRKLYDAAFSGAVGVLLPLVAAGLWLSQAQAPGSLRKGAAMVTPAIYIAVVSIVFESGENMRFRFFLEPALWIFVVTQFTSVLKRRAPLAGC
jgi:hypothetical protein